MDVAPAEPQPETYALICGGGTAGHVLPALAIADALVARGHDPSTLHFVGSEGRIGAKLVHEVAGDQRAAKRALGAPDDRSMVLVVGGSLGARTLNHAVLEALAKWSDRADLTVHHVVGERDWDEIEAARPDLPVGGVRYEP